MRFHRLVLAAIVSAAWLLGGCVPPPPKPLRSQLEVRQFQTRSYTNKDTKLVMKAVINALQDEAFIIRNADKELGFVNATKEYDVTDSNDVFWSVFLEGERARWNKNSIIEASVNVSEFGDETRVRVIFQAKTIDNFGSPVTAAQMEDERYYQEFFAKVDKSIFFEREKI